MFFFFFFLAFFVGYNVSFIKIIRISISHRLNVFFSHFFREILFSCVLKFEKKKILKIKITAKYFTSLF